MQLRESKLAGVINSDKEMQLTFLGLGGPVRTSAISM
jgi:hypothetical protein